MQKRSGTKIIQSSFQRSVIKNLIEIHKIYNDFVKPISYLDNKQLKYKEIKQAMFFFSEPYRIESGSRSRNSED